MNKPRLSERMQTIASMVIPKEAMADIGTDHGYIPASLLADGICPYAVLSDINSGPLEICKENLSEYEIDPKSYDVRLGSGFEVLKSSEVSTVVIAGMGGELIESMFRAAPEKVRTYKRIVVQPRSFEPELRTFLTTDGYKIVDYCLAEERGRICEVFAVEPCEENEKEPDLGIVSAFLINKGDRLLKEYLSAKIRKSRAILDSLKLSESESSRQAEERERAAVSELEAFFEKLK